MYNAGIVCSVYEAGSNETILREALKIDCEEGMWMKAAEDHAQ
jgi:hypothetical protein